MKYSHLNEQTLILEYVKQLRLQNKFCVDVGASDGAGMSNTYTLFLEGWNGLAVEYESQKFSSLAHRYKRFSGVNLAKCKVTPVNVCALLEANQVPEKFDFLSLDIDGYDHYVLQKILNQFRPSLICTEINEKIPPPIKFTVNWYPEYVWSGDHFYGQSISQLYDLCTQCRYSLVELHYNNAFLIPEEINIYPSLTPEEAYTKGYIKRPDRKEKFPWNADVEELISLSPQEAVIFINKFFRKYEGKFVCYLEEFGDYRQLKTNQQYPLRKENHRLKSRDTISQKPDELLGQAASAQPNRTNASRYTQLPVHFFTIVLNGEPFIRYHIDVFKKLPFKWHWHVIEGVADLKHDTAWAVSNGGQVPAEWHRAGRSIDGTSEYLDQLAQHYPDQITLYRQPQGRFWDGKRQMVNAPLTNIRAECLLWQVDSDELWTVDQICTARNLFLQKPERTAAFFHCHYFVGPELVTITPEAWSHHTAQEWLRVWRYRPGMRWARHEPPCLAVQVGEQWIDVARQNPFLHAETEQHGLVFTHYAYATEVQVAFKEKYYGYKGAVEQWRRLQRAQRVPRTPVNLRDYLAWVGDHAQADRVERRVIGAGVVPIPWNFDPPPNGHQANLELPVNQAAQSKSRRVVIDGVVFQKQEYRYPGISRVWRHLIPELVKALPECEFIFLKRKETDIDFAGVTNYEAPTFHFGPESVLDADDARLAQICRELNADVFISTYFTRAPGVRNVLMVYDMIPEVLNGDLSHPMWQAKQRAIVTANMIITISEATKVDLCRISQIPPERVTVAHLGVESRFQPTDWQTVARFASKYQIKHPYFLMVGARGGYKNSAIVFKAFGLLPNNREMQLFSFGDRHLHPHEAELAKSLNYSSVQWLSDEELPAAYAGALALVYPSVYEGFGLPVLEAMACGCPVITTRKASLPEVGGDVALYIDPTSPDELAQAMQTVLQPEVRLKLAARGVDWAANFTWQRAAAIVANVLIDAANSSINVDDKLSAELQPFDNDLIVQAEQAKAAQNWSEASDMLMTALEQYPGVAPGRLWASLGDCFTKAGNLSEAEAALLGGLEFEPDNLDILNQLAELYLKQNRGCEFNPYLNRAFNVLDNNDVETLLAIGNLAIKVGLFDLALQIFSRLQSVVPQATKIDTVVKQLESLV